MTNQQFCYWLQGYFEIGNDVTLNGPVMRLVEKQLQCIVQPLGQFTSWLKEVCDYIATKQYTDQICACFSPIVKRSLNSIFFHVIDNSYDTEQPREELQAIHDGKA